MKKNDVIRLAITGVTAEGSGVGRHEGMAVFVPAAAPGDEIDCKIVKVLKSYAFGIIHSLVTPSPHRTEPDCPSFRQCGGCVFRHMGYESECRIKKDRAEEALRRIGGFQNLSVAPLQGARVRNRYRNKAQIPLGLSPKGELVMGFFAPHSHRIIPMEDCLLQPRAFTAAMEVFRRWQKTYNVPVYNEESHKGLLRHLYLRQGQQTGELMVCVVVNGQSLPHGEELARLLKAEIPGFCSLIVNQNREKTNVILGKTCQTIYGEDHITDVLCGLKFRLSPLSFYQINRDQAEKLYEKAGEYAALTGTETLLDLYCGTGTIGLSMAKNAGRVIGVEVVEEAVENARENAAENGIQNAEFLCADAAKAAAVLKERGETPQVVILDPPRKGCDPALITTVADLAPSRIVYVSCDPATLARDLKHFAALGYEPREVTPFDLFPATSHVECCCLLTKTE